jgi:taurine dioxygenase
MEPRDTGCTSPSSPQEIAMPDAVSLKPLGPTIGAEVSGLDVSRPLDDNTIDWIAASLADRAVLVLRNQKLDASQIGAFGRRFGVPKPHLLEGYQHPDFPEVSMVTNVAADGSIDPFGVKRATTWHSDETYKQTTPRLAMLHGIEVPSDGGGTLFADMRAAFEALPPAQREKLRGMTALHQFTSGPADARSAYAMRVSADKLANLPDWEHPAIVRHPGNGREILFVNPSHTHGFVGLGRDEGIKLVEELGIHSVQPQFVYHHHWRAGDLVIWDELSTMHKGAGDSPPTQRRVLMRTIVHPATPYWRATEHRAA